jgi:hypothetical protein
VALGSACCTHRPTSATDTTHNYTCAGHYPAEAVAALLDASTAPKLAQLLEMEARHPAVAYGIPCVAPLHLSSHLPTMVHLYGDRRASTPLLGAVSSLGKWLRAACRALAALEQHGGDRTAAAAATAEAVPGATGANLAAWVREDPAGLFQLTIEWSKRLVVTSSCSLAHAVALLDPQLDAHWGALAQQLPPARRTRAWQREAALLEVRSYLVAELGMGCTVDLAYMSVLSEKQQQHLPGILPQLQAAVAEQQRAAAAQQAAKLAKAAEQLGMSQQLEAQLEGLHLQHELAPAGSIGDGTSTSTSTSSGGGCVQVRVGSLGGEEPATAASAGQQSEPPGNSNRRVSAVPAVTEDARVAGVALLVGVKAAGALADVGLLLRQVQGVVGRQPGAGCILQFSRAVASNLLLIDQRCNNAAVAAGVLLPVLTQLLPAEQAAALEAATACTSRRENSRGPSQKEVGAALRALGHAAIPGQPGCSHPGCLNLEGPSEAALSTQACAACRGTRYCSRSCQKAHWQAHKAACKAAVAATKAAGMCSVPGT